MAPANGQAVLTVSDGATDMGTVSSINMTVDNVQVQNSTGDWITVSSTPETYDLLQLNASGASALLADANLPPGNYGQVRMQISNVMVTDSNGGQEAILPSGELTILGGFEVTTNSTTALTFDFLASESLYMTRDGRYVFAPVIHMREWRGVQVDTGNWANIRINGGWIGNDMLFGMDEHGNFEVGSSIPANTSTTINGVSIVVLGPVAILNERQSQHSNGQGNGGSMSGNGQTQGNIYDVAGNESGPGIADTLTACTAISDSQQRLSCIAQWCTSSNRDYNQCYNLTDMGDQLGCLSKCNPNSNT
jgi:hypothetical protein